MWGLMLNLLNCGIIINAGNSLFDANDSSSSAVGVVSP
jgi:hypothetical protein